MTTTTTIGPRIAACRRRRRVSQSRLAHLLGISQSTISRFEATADLKFNMPMVGRVAEGLGCLIPDLVPAEWMLWAREVLHVKENFSAFCSNPTCESNCHGVTQKDEEPFVKFIPQFFNMSQYDQVVFCYRCGSPMVKRCPNCERYLGRTVGPFCVRCGTSLCGRPTEKDLDDIHAYHVDGDWPDDDDEDEDEDDDDNIPSPKVLSPEIKAVLEAQAKLRGPESPV